MMATELEEAVDLELLLGLTPRCEDDHQWYDDDDELVTPVCALEAVAVLTQSCPPLPGEVSQELVCRPLAEWLEGEGACTAHELKEHFQVRWL